MLSIKVSITVKIDGGSTISTTTDLDVSAHGTVVKDIPPELGGTPGKATIPVQPEDAAHVKLLMITASSYSDDLTYKATEADGSDLATPTTEYALDQPQTFVGDAVKAVDSAPKNLTFSNATADAITVTIVVARTAGN